MDLLFFQKLNGLVFTSKVLDYIGIFLASYLPWILGAILVALFIWKKNRIMVLSAAISVFLSRIVITEILKIIIHRPRPYVVLDLVKKIIPENSDLKSMPSGHAAIFFAIAMAVYLYNKKLGIFFFIGAILMGIARVFCGVHWPSDILVGAIIGILSAIIVDKIFKLHKN